MAPMTIRFSTASLLFASLSLAGCDRCNRTLPAQAPSNASKSYAYSQQPGSGPVVLAENNRQVVAGGALSEAQMARVAGSESTSQAAPEGTAIVECASAGQPVSPTLFGVAFADADADLGATAHRWGGNTTSRYNWRIGAWNTGAGWFWENIKVDSHEVFLAKAAAKGGRAAITVPIMGWVAKDTSSSAFPVAKAGAQEKTDEYRPGAGNGLSPDGKTPLPAGDPTLTSVQTTPADIGEWVSKMRAAEKAAGKRVVYEYILDNEPGLWNTSHRDVHPAPMSYDELLERTIAYATAIRKADPDALIAGPASFGWWEYFYSTVDHDKGFTLKPDRRAHGDEPLLAWYLRKLAEHEKKTGVRLLDVLDVHFYPQADGVQFPDGKGGDGDGKTDEATNALRYRVTRALWDRAYKDESWINDEVYLIPRMKELIAQNYPGLGLQIGEYNFGAEHHAAGAVALAEGLGRMAQGGVSHAFYWTAPAKNSPAYWAFRAFTNFDGRGGRFLSTLVPSSSPPGTSLYASRSADGKKWVLIALNFSAREAKTLSLNMAGCKPMGSELHATYTGEASGFVRGGGMLSPASAAAIPLVLPPTSVTVFELAESAP